MAHPPRHPGGGANYGLAIEMLQVKHGQSREIVTDIFTQTTQR